MKDAENHDEARDVVRIVVDGDEAWTIPWPVAYEFLRVVTHANVFSPPKTPADATEFLRDLRRSSGYRQIIETDGHAALCDRLVADTSARGNFVHDVHIAALLIENGVREFITADGDFKRFDGFAVRHPFRPRRAR